jgi:tRNA-Thr(GGU) m(6)t(6)A37 methyltransferase TsaA
MSSIILTPVGVVKSSIDQPIDCAWDDVTACIVLDDARFTAASLTGLQEFSHVEIVFAFHLVGESDIHFAARRPRGRTDWPEVGIFAQRGKDRPNRIGVSVCRLISVGELELQVQGLDAIDGTPVLDIKPYMAEFAPRGEVREPQWAKELMSTYWNRGRP